MSRLVDLPLEIKWSGPLRSYDLDDPTDRLIVYELVLQEGDDAQVRKYIDVDLLFELWDEMYLPVGVETAWADYFERVRKTPVRRRWASPDRVRDHPTFVRLAVVDGEEVTEVDICYDHQWRPSVSTSVGPARSPEELAVDKLLALYGRSLPRDFVDVFRLHQIYGIEVMMRWAPEKDRGFNGYRLAETLGAMARFPRAEFEIDDESFSGLHTFYADLRAELIRRTVESRDTPPTG